MAGTAIAVIVVMAFAPSRASAACGDYLRIDGQAVPMPHDGPNCSERQTPPIAPMSVPPAESESAKPFVEWLQADPWPTDSARRVAEATLLALPDPLRDSIFHPPRHG